MNDDTYLMPDPWIDEVDGWMDVVNETTGEIAFRKDHPRYRQTKSDFKALGYDLDACRTIKEVIDIQIRHRPFFEAMLSARVQALDPNNLEHQLLQAIFRRDNAERTRLSNLLKKRKALGLTLVK